MKAPTEPDAYEHRFAARSQWTRNPKIPLTLTLTLTLTLKHPPQPRIELNACDYVHIRRVFEVYMLAPPEPDTYARRFPHFVQPTHAVTCGTVTQEVRIRPPRPQIELIPRVQCPSAQH